MTNDEEVDVWWGSYSVRTMIPSFLLCLLLTAAIAASAGYLWFLDIATFHLLWHVALGLIGTIWLVQLCRCGYRATSYNYRLTTRRLFCDRGFFHPDNREVDLFHVTGLVVEFEPWERLVGIGRLRILLDNGAQALILEGIYNPTQIAVEIRSHLRRDLEIHRRV